MFIEYPRVLCSQDEMTTPARRAARVDTTALRVLAIVLIANSHLEDLYPFRPLAADGLIGNSLFFMLSGLGLALSPRTIEGRFVSWYRRRMGRIYPSLWLAVLFGAALTSASWRGWGAGDVVRNLIWPTPYGFVAQIIVFYPVFFLLRRLKDSRAEIAAILGLTAPYLAVALFHYDLHILSWIFYFQVMVFGGLLAGRLERMGRHAGRDAIVLGLTMLVYVGVKFAMVTGRIPSHVAVLHILCVPILASLLGVCVTPTAQALAHYPRLGPALSGIGALTLEIYLVHGFVYADARVAKLPFPINLAAFWAATLPMAWVLARSADRARGLIGAATSAWRRPNAGGANSERRARHADRHSGPVTLLEVNPAGEDRFRPASAGPHPPPVPSPVPAR